MKPAPTSIWNPAWPWQCRRSTACGPPVASCGARRERWTPSPLRLQYFFEKRQRARVVGLAQPEHSLLAHLSIPVGAGYLDQHGHALAIGKLLQGKHRLLLDLGIRIVIDGARNRADGFLAGLLRQPEERLPAHVGTGIVVRHRDHGINRLRFLADRKREDGLFADMVAGVGGDDAAQVFVAAPAARFAHPEDGLFAQRFGLAGGGEPFQGFVRRAIRVQRDGRHCAVADVVAVQSDEGRQECYAFGRAYVANPAYRDAVGIELAIARNDADFAYTVVLDAEHDLRLFGWLQVHGSGWAHAPAVAIAIVAILFVARDGGDGVADPGRLRLGVLFAEAPLKRGLALGEQGRGEETGQQACPTECRFHLFRSSSMYSVASLEPIIESLLTIVFFISGLVSLRARSTMPLALPWMNSALTISPRTPGSVSELYIDTSAAPVCSPPISPKLWMAALRSRMSFSPRATSSSLSLLPPMNMECRMVSFTSTVGSA